MTIVHSVVLFASFFGAGVLCGLTVRWLQRIREVA